VVKGGGKKGARRIWEERPGVSIEGGNGVHREKEKGGKLEAGGFREQSFQCGSR